MFKIVLSMYLKIYKIFLRKDKENNQQTEIKMQNNCETSNQCTSCSTNTEDSSVKSYTFNSKELFDIINKEVQYEHNLISNRMTWYVTSQSFLIAAFFVSGSKCHEYQLLAKILIPALGILNSWIISMSLLAAIEAMNRLRKYEHEQIFKNDQNLQQIEPLNSRFKQEGQNDLVFFDNFGWIHEFGLLPPKLIPLIFILTWLFIWVWVWVLKYPTVC